MLHVLINTIFPIFSIILLGYFLEIKKIITADFAKPANQMVFYVAIPAMLLSEISQAPFKENFNMEAVICVLGALAGGGLLSLVAVKLLRIPQGRRGTFVHSGFHGNIGYMSYAIAYYSLGESHFARMAILSSFLMLGQNLLAVWALTAFNKKHRMTGQSWTLLKHFLKNPIIVTVTFGIAYSAIGLTIPIPIQKGLTILSGMAFPMALLLIGASLSFGAFKTMAKEIVGIGMLKLVLVPLMGYGLMLLLHVPPPLILAGMILLASPPATITYVMATELGGDPELAATSVSIHTMLSAFSYSLILSAFAV